MLKQVWLYLYNSNLNNRWFMGIFLLCLRHFNFCFVAQLQDILAERPALRVSRGANAAAAARGTREFPASSAPVQLLAQVWELSGAALSLEIISFLKENAVLCADTFVQHWYQVECIHCRRGVEFLKWEHVVAEDCFRGFLQSWFQGSLMTFSIQ